MNNISWNIDEDPSRTAKARSSPARWVRLDPRGGWNDLFAKLRLQRAERPNNRSAPSHHLTSGRRAAGKDLLETQGKVRRGQIQTRAKRNLRRQRLCPTHRYCIQHDARHAYRSVPASPGVKWAR